MLTENEIIINDSAKVANVFDSYFESLTESLDLFHWAPEPYDQAKDSLESIVHRFSHHPSINKINQNIKISKKNYFAAVAVDTAKKHHKSIT